MTNAPPEDDFDVLDCPKCGLDMHYTGLPNLSGPTRVRFYKCTRCGIIEVPVAGSDENLDGWG